MTTNQLAWMLLANPDFAKRADLSELLGDPDTLAMLGIGAGGVALGGPLLASGVAHSPLLAPITKSAPARPSAMAEGLEGKERSKLRGMFEHLVDPSSAQSHRRGLEMRAGMSGSKSKGLAEDLRAGHGTGEKVLRGLSLAGAPLKLLGAPITAPANALRRMYQRKSFDSSMRSSMKPIEQWLMGMLDPELRTSPDQAYLAKEVRQLTGGKELAMSDFREAYDKKKQSK
jgi:hypothetical protein